ncbi:MAG: helix-turn-helix domain-containing protein [Bacteroidetes bacterium]|nr:helix-turn-helix domain-containing protein [Bacteroidota bacterium]
MGQILEYAGLLGICLSLMVLTAVLASGPTPFVFLIGPMSYLYVRSIFRDDASLSKFDYLHFLMFTLEFIGMIPYYLSSWDSKLYIANTIQHTDWHVIRLNLNWIFRSPINSILRPLHILVYIILQWVLIIRYYRNSAHVNIPNIQKDVVRRWLYVFTVLLTAVLINYLIISRYLFMYRDKLEFKANSQLFVLTATFTVSVLNLVILLYPQILYGLPRMIFPQSASVNINQAPEEELLLKTSQHQDALEQHTISIEEKLKVLFQKMEPWVDKNFSLASLAFLIDVPEHHLRYYFNHYLNISFPTYRNQLRVNHVKKALESGEFNRLSMEGIGQMAGFASKSSFFSVFKNETGMTPHEYLLKIQDEE